MIKPIFCILLNNFRYLFDRIYNSLIQIILKTIFIHNLYLTYKIITSFVFNNVLVYFSKSEWAKDDSTLSIISVIYKTEEDYENSISLNREIIAN